jgi:tetratricopeptide (TPR) repeat protein
LNRYWLLPSLIRENAIGQSAAWLVRLHRHILGEQALGRLSVADPSNAGWQRDLSVLYEWIGDALGRQDKLDEALKVYKDSLAIREGLAAADPSNMEWQTNLAHDYDDIGNVLGAQGKLDEALKAYRDGLAIRERLAVANPSNSRWESELSASYEMIGDVLKAQDKLEEAFRTYHDSLAIRERFASANPSDARWRKDIQSSVNKIGALAYYLVLARNFGKALEAADETISASSEQIWLYTNRAHALMFLGRVDEARALYLRYRGEKKVEGEKSWETVVLDDFAGLRRAGLTHPLMDEIESKFSTNG